jgi:uncharacterized protein YaeQ
LQEPTSSALAPNGFSPAAFAVGTRRLDPGTDVLGAPEASRLHKAAKAARRVAVYAHREVTPWLQRLASERIYRAEALEIYVMDRDLVAALVTRLERRMDFDLSVSERTLYVSMGGETLTGTVELRRLHS